MTRKRFDSQFAFPWSHVMREGYDKLAARRNTTVSQIIRDVLWDNLLKEGLVKDEPLTPIAQPETTE